MNWTEQINHARAQGDWSEVIRSVPFARFLDLRMDVKGEEFTCVLPFQEKLIGNPICLLYTSPSPRDVEESRMPSSA